MSKVMSETGNERLSYSIDIIKYRYYHVSILSCIDIFKNRYFQVSILSRLTLLCTFGLWCHLANELRISQGQSKIQ